MSRNIFITGTGTDVGKTYVTGLIVKKLKESGADAAYYKAAMSGNERRPDGSLIPGDALQVKTMSGIRQPLEEMCPSMRRQSPRIWHRGWREIRSGWKRYWKSSMKSVKNTNM